PSRTSAGPSLHLRRARRAPRLAPFPYTPLFRSDLSGHAAGQHGAIVVLAQHGGRARAIQRTPEKFVGQITVRSGQGGIGRPARQDRKSTRLNSSHVKISYAVFCLKKKRTRVTVG